MLIALYELYAQISVKEIDVETFSAIHESLPCVFSAVAFEGYSVLSL